MSGDNDRAHTPAAPPPEPSTPTQPDEDGWEAALADMPNLPTPAPPAAATDPEAAAAAAMNTATPQPAPMHDVGTVTAPMLPVAPLPLQNPVPALAGAPALHLQAHNQGPSIIIPQIPDYPRRKPQPLTGPLLSVYGGLLWSFVLAGQFTTSWMSGGPLDERWAASIVFVATIVSGILALCRAQSAAPVAAARVVGRAAFAFVGAFVGWVATVFVAAVAGNMASRNHDVLIAFVLVTLAVLASVLGPRLTSPSPHIAPTHGRKVMQVMFWAGLAVVTLIAGAELVANG